MLVWLSQIGSAPQYGDGVMGFCFDDGVFGSRTGILTWVALWFTGASTGNRSRLSSVAPKIGPLALTRGLRLSVEISSCR